jgi:2-phosphoglycerate kinase
VAPAHNKSLHWIFTPLRSLKTSEFRRYLAEADIPIMIFLLGGPPRVGKSIISSEIRQKHAVSVVSTDTLGAVLENVLSAY